MTASARASAANSGVSLLGVNRWGRKQAASGEVHQIRPCLQTTKVYMLNKRQKNITSVFSNKCVQLTRDPLGEVNIFSVISDSSYMATVHIK